MQVSAVLIGLPIPIPVLSKAVRAGFPSPADDFVEDEIDLQRLLIANRPATFLVRWVNIVELASAVISHLDGAPFVEPSLMPFSPIVGMDAQLDRERVTDDEAMLFVSDLRSTSARGG
ncbi:hypothetical protein [Methylobacterium sp. J-076]|uniref:hypothetical protein n=1 Tax=Methylobacterium sp. J-076 TaxID=2836655 RepID=UPI001FB99EEB|nr:hypothetical protein [Methylobacterium sp. J-076]MCJ2015546.1 hypothetical protein [Methylobacterium sp. J-076]